VCRVVYRAHVMGWEMCAGVLGGNCDRTIPGGSAGVPV
jgi:hypothetical protein